MRYILALILLIIPSYSFAELTWGFKSPAFDGGAGYSTHVLSIEQLQYNRRKEIADQKASEEAAIQREIDNSILNKFLTNVQIRIYATLSKQLVDNMFASCDATDTTCSAATSGTATVEGATISWVRDDVNETISLTIVETDGTTTEITVPTGDFAF
jgi:ketopantoate reductase